MTWPAPRTVRASRVALVLAAGTLAMAALGACGLLDGAGLMTSPIALAPECEQEDSCDCGGPGCHCEDGACYCDRADCSAESIVTGASCVDDGCFCHDGLCGCALGGDCEVTSGNPARACRGEGCLCDQDQCKCENPVAESCACTGGTDVGNGCVPEPLFNPP